MKRKRSEQRLKKKKVKKEINETEKKKEDATVRLKGRSGGMKVDAVKVDNSRFDDKMR